MSDLDDDLLALAGEGSESESEKSPVNDSNLSDSKGRKIETSDLEFEGDGDDDEDDKGDAASQKPDFDNKYEGSMDDQMDEEEEEDLKNPYPLEGKYRDEEDREQLLSMDEIQREQILFERSQEMESYNEKIYLRERMEQSQGATGGVKATRSSNRAKVGSNKSSKLDKLGELRKQREQKSRKERRKYEDYSEDEDEADEDNDEAGGFYEEDEDEYGYGDEEDVVWGSGTSSKFKRRSSEKAALEDINRVKLGRSFLVKYCFHSDFNEAVLDCYGRVNIGFDRKLRQTMYRMVKIVDIKNIPEKAYQVPNFKCDIYLTVSQNRDQQKDFPVSIFSDSPILHEEFDRYINELNKTGEATPFLDDVNEKLVQIQHLTSRGISDKDVNDMVAKKRKLQSNFRAYDAVYEKTKLMDQIKIARQENDFERVKQLMQEVHKIEDFLVLQTKAHNNSESLSTMSKVNERNRKLNQIKIRKAELKSNLNKKTADNDGSDAFARLKTTIRVFYDDLKKQENERAIVDAKKNYKKNLAEKTENEAKIASSTYRCLGAMDKFISNIDFDFNLEV